MTPCWMPVCPVDVTALAAWLADARPHWPALPCPTKPQRIAPPAELTGPIVSHVLARFDGAARTVADAVRLSRMLPGQRHDLHVDRQRSDWITRIHVPIVTNPGAWMLWEEEPGRVHFEAGVAYTFDTTRRHAFGNDGATERVHLMFDVLRRDA